jgi:hypothetical protein
MVCLGLERGGNRSITVERSTKLTGKRPRLIVIFERNPDLHSRIEEAIGEK